MRRLAAAAALCSLTALPALAEDRPTPGAVLRARDAVFARPEFDYSERRGSQSLLERLFGWWVDLLEGFQRQHPILFLVLLGSMTLVALVLVAHIVWTVRVARRADWQGDRPDDLETALRRLDPRPFRARAVSLAAEGRLEEAVRDLYTALLLVLDRRGSVRYASHKALLDYRIEAARDPDAREALAAFEAAYPPGSFGRRPPSRERFDGLVGTLDRVGAQR